MEVKRFTQFLLKPVSIAPLVVFRIIFGLLMLYTILRYAYKGWISELYIEPTYHFTFFEWLPVFGTDVIWVFVILGFCAFFITIGFLFRISSFLFCLLFTYVELLDKTYYLNHYYLVCLLSFLLVFTSANRYFSVDTLLFPSSKRNWCPSWQIGIFRVQLSIVYFFAGLAKVNPDWLLLAEPLSTWFPGKYQLPILGSFMHLKTTAFLFSWAGCIYDLSIWAFLWWRKSRPLAYVAVIVFHVLTGILFPRIGMFPAIMIFSTLMFFSSEWHQRILDPIHEVWGKIRKTPAKTSLVSSPILQSEEVFLNDWKKITTIGFLVAYVGIQLFLPMRYLRFGGNLFWHEQGYRFSWRVMLMEKSGHTVFVMKDPVTDLQKEVNLDAYLTAFQRQQLSTQPDMIWQFAQHLGQEFETNRGYRPQIYVKSRLSLNGRRSQVFLNDSIDVCTLDSPYQRPDWIISFSNG